MAFGYLAIRYAAIGAGGHATPSITPWRLLRRRPAGRLRYDRENSVRTTTYTPSTTKGRATFLSCAVAQGWQRQAFFLRCVRYLPVSGWLFSMDHSSCSVRSSAWIGAYFADQEAYESIVALISGRGSNMASLLAAVADGSLPVRVAAVIANRPDAPGLQSAASAGVATQVVDHRAYADRVAFDTALARTIDAHAPDLVVLAGFMRILSNAFVEHYSGRLINIHPSLLPSFPGLHTLSSARSTRACARMVTPAMHFVTPALDHGPLIVQAAVPVLGDDDATRGGAGARAGTPDLPAGGALVRRGDVYASRPGACASVRRKTPARR